MTILTQKGSWASALLSIIYLAVPQNGMAENMAIAPGGEYAQIDTRLANETIQFLAKGTPTEKLRAIDRIKSNPGDYAPPVLYVLSNVLFDIGEKDEGAFWFYAGQLRAEYDVMRSTNTKAREAVDVLNYRHGEVINKYTFKDLPKLEALIPRIIDWDRKTPYKYDPRWISLYGMDAIFSGLSGGALPSNPAGLVRPKEQWDEIAEKNRQEYLAEFKKAMAYMRKQKN